MVLLSAADAETVKAANANRIRSFFIGNPLLCVINFRFWPKARPEWGTNIE